MRELWLRFTRHAEPVSGMWDHTPVAYETRDLVGPAGAAVRARSGRNHLVSQEIARCLSAPPAEPRARTTRDNSVERTVLDSTAPLRSRLWSERDGHCVSVLNPLLNTTSRRHERPAVHQIPIRDDDMRRIRRVGDQRSSLVVVDRGHRHGGRALAEVGRSGRVEIQCRNGGAA